MLHRLSPGSARRITLGADKGYDAASFVGDLRQMAVTPHIAKNDTVTKTGKRRRSAIDARTTRHPGYAASQRVRKRIEEAFGWAKTVAGLGKTNCAGPSASRSCPSVLSVSISSCGSVTISARRCRR
jgi:hypothetical protein